MSFESILTIILLVGGIAACMHGLYLLFSGTFAIRCGEGPAKLAGGILLLVIGTVVICLEMTFSNSERQENYDTAVAKGYTVYVDGQEADPIGITLSEYKMEIDNDTQVVKLTKSSSSSPIIVPIIH